LHEKVTGRYASWEAWNNVVGTTVIGCVVRSKQNESGATKATPILSCC
jgi:hypothetical protein